MTEQQFAYWLQGFAELNGHTAPTTEQWKSIREHLATVFKKVTPPVALTPVQLNPLRAYEKVFQQQPPYPAPSDKIIC